MGKGTKQQKETARKAAQFLEERIVDAFAFGFTMGIRADLPSDITNEDLNNTLRWALNKYYENIKQRAAQIEKGGLKVAKG